MSKVVYVCMERKIGCIKDEYSNKSSFPFCRMILNSWVLHVLELMVANINVKCCICFYLKFKSQSFTFLCRARLNFSCWLFILLENEENYSWMKMKGRENYYCWCFLSWKFKFSKIFDMITKKGNKGLWRNFVWEILMKENCSWYLFDNWVFVFRTVQTFVDFLNTF